MRVSQWASSPVVAALWVGTDPTTPSRHAAMTRSGPDTSVIGAAINGTVNRFANASEMDTSTPCENHERQGAHLSKCRKSGDDAC